MIPSSRTPLAFLAVLITGILWGTTGTAATFAPGVGPLAIASASLGVGGLLQAAIAFPDIRRQLPRLISNPAARRLILVGGFSVFLYPLAFYSSMHLAGVAVGTVISLASAPLFSGLYERFLRGTTLSPRWGIAAAIGIVGSALLCIAKMNAHPTGTADSATDQIASSAGSQNVIVGIILGLVAGMTYAGYSYAAHRLMGPEINAGRGAAMGTIFGVGGLLLMPVLLVTGRPIIDTHNGLAVALYMALIPMFLGYVLFGYGLTSISASTATTITLAEPAVAAILAVVVVGERLSAMGWVGFGMICIVLLIVALPTKKTSRKTSRKTYRKQPRLPR